MDKSSFDKVFKKARVAEKRVLIKELCKERKVLDVGCIGQDYTAVAGNWLHHEIKDVAKALTGVDIATEQIEKLNKQGYHILHQSQLADLNESFDVVVMADVIEHVDDPVGFLKFYARFLGPSGIMVISTPNANRAVNFLSILLYNNYSVNDEHTCWFCPKTLNEVIRRSSLHVKEFYWLKRYYQYKGLNFTSRLLTAISDILASCRKNFNQNLMIIVSK